MLCWVAIHHLRFGIMSQYEKCEWTVWQFPGINKWKLLFSQASSKILIVCRYIYDIRQVHSNMNLFENMHNHPLSSGKDGSHNWGGFAL